MNLVYGTTRPRNAGYHPLASASGVSTRGERRVIPGLGLSCGLYELRKENAEDARIRRVEARLLDAKLVGGNGVNTTARRDYIRELLFGVGTQINKESEGAVLLKGTNGSTVVEVNVDSRTTVVIDPSADTVTVRVGIKALDRDIPRGRLDIPVPLKGKPDRDEEMAMESANRILIMKCTSFNDPHAIDTLANARLVLALYIQIQ